jgi:hypothetical protein
MGSPLGIRYIWCNSLFETLMICPSLLPRGILTSHHCPSGVFLREVLIKVSKAPERCMSSKPAYA